ncbi:MAG TPA: glycosyltransferase [Candidatus Polarisedimenticolaceae bacterium]|nr:glycosyltransferase [Candidatus Polarisedimenticolaceae bacterium]
MLEGQSIVCFANDWSADPTSKTHIMRILARKNRVLWVDSIGMRRPAATAYDARRIGKKLRRVFRGCRPVEPGLFVGSPLALPFPGNAAADRLNASVLSAWLKWQLKRLRMTRPILWSFMPNVSGLVGRLGERMVVYHCVDDYAEFAGVSRDSIRRLEADLVRRADVVLTSSEQLRDERLTLNPRTHFVTHGVDVEHFGRALDPATPVPEELRHLPRPVVGFFGLIAEWVDVALIRAMADRHPDWSIVLVGRASTDLSSIEGRPNVRLLGRKPYAALPAYCRGFDAGIVPFTMTDLTVRANPLKLREYLAAGLPVASTPLPEVLRYGSLVETGRSDHEFVAAVERALARRSPAAMKARVDAMRAESWEARVEEITSLLSGPLARAVA